MKNIDTKEIIISSTKSIFGMIPSVGTALNELFFDYNGRIKQKRLNHFVKILREYYSQNIDVNIENIKTEDFNDLFESVLKRVVTTKSTLKLKRFRDILIKELSNPTTETELIDIYLDLITSLSEEEILILNNHKYFNKAYDLELDNLRYLKERFEKIMENKKKETIIFERSKYEDDFLKLKSSIEEIESKHKSFEKYRSANYYNLNENKFFFFKQRLYSKGLLYDIGIGGIGTKPFAYMNITEFGIEFIKFIKGN